VLTTHYMEEADRLCQRVAVIDHGKLLALDTPQALKRTVGGDVVVSPPFPFQTRFNRSGIRPVPRIDEPVDPRHVSALESHFPDFRRASEEGGLSVADFDAFGPTRRTLRQFLAASGELAALVRDYMVPNPD